jgi:hypothetical protein
LHHQKLTTMKKLTLLLIIAVGLALQTTAQNYQTLNSGRIASFEDQWNDIKFVRIDSAWYQTDSVLVPFGGFHEIEHLACYIIDGPSWLGKEIIIRDDGWNLFVTGEEDTVHIHTGAVQGENWTAYERPGELIITAEVISHGLMSFLELQDSVKTIGFQAHDPLMQPVSHQVNDMTIAISKNHGLVRTLNFAYFPDLTATFGWEDEVLREFEIVGMSDPQVGVQNLTWLEVHDFQPGDEIHVYYHSYLVFSPITETQPLIHKYLEREDFTDSVRYTIERITSIYIEDPQGSTFEFIHDTITETFYPDVNFDKLPGETVIEEDWSAFSYKMNTLWHQAKIRPTPEIWLYQTDELCWNYLIMDGCLSDYTWYKGLGGPYHSCNAWGEVERTLMYYKKGDETWGTPLIIVGIDEAAHNSDITLYPNPAAESVWISSSDAGLPLTIEFYDLYGRLIKTATVTEVSQKVGLQAFSKGIYAYRILNSNGIVRQGKIAVE